MLSNGQSVSLFGVGGGNVYLLWFVHVCVCLIVLMFGSFRCACIICVDSLCCLNSEIKIHVSLFRYYINLFHSAHITLSEIATTLSDADSDLSPLPSPHISFHGTIVLPCTALSPDVFVPAV